MTGKNSNRSLPEVGLQAVAAHFAMKGTFASGTAYGSGHIHDTFLVRMRERSAPDYILQRINHVIFKDIPALMANIVRVSEHIRSQVGDPDREALTVIPAADGLPFHRDGEGRYWRCYRFIEHRETGERPDCPEQAFEAGSLFGRFIVQLADLPPSCLHVIIPRFHDVEFRLDEFTQALLADPLGRGREAEAEIALVNERAESMKRVLAAGRAGRIPLRITHNDTKFNNVLFDRRGRGRCLIDLDTVMPGYVLYDFGDAVRSAANTAREDEIEIARVRLDMDVYRELARGFLRGLRGGLSVGECELLPFGAALLAYTVGLRFLTDHLAGDVYFKTARPGHNLQRARAQFALLGDMEKRFAEMEEIVRGLAAAAIS